MWVPGSGSLETWDWTIQHSYVYSYLSFRGYQVAKLVMDGFWKELERAGKEFNPYHAGFLQLVAISERDDQIEEYRPHIEYFFKKTQHLPAFFANPPGYRSLNTVRSTIGKEIAAALQTQPKEFTWKDYIDQGAVIAGSPATVREELEKAITEMRVGNLMLLLHFGDMPRERTMRNTELFAKEVMPHLKDLWSEYPHNWWPKPVGGSQDVTSSTVT